MKIEKVRDFLAMIRSLILFFRVSSKRQAIFMSLQDKNDLSSRSLRTFYLTRWCMRTVSLKTIYTNYAILIIFLKNILNEKMRAVLRQVDFVNK